MGWRRGERQLAGTVGRDSWQGARGQLRWGYGGVKDPIPQSANSPTKYNKRHALENESVPFCIRSDL